MSWRHHLARRVLAVALAAVVLWIALLVVIDRSRDEWLREREACRAANLRTDEARDSRRVLRRFLYTAATARVAAYRRDGHATDLRAARAYFALIRRVDDPARRDCLELLPAPLGVSEGDDPRAGADLSRQHGAAP